MNRSSQDTSFIHVCISIWGYLFSSSSDNVSCPNSYLEFVFECDWVLACLAAVWGRWAAKYFQYWPWWIENALSAMCRCAVGSQLSAVASWMLMGSSSVPPWTTSDIVKLPQQFLRSASCSLWMHFSSSVQTNLFIHLRVHPVTFLLDRHSERVNHPLICYCCVFQFVKPQFPITWLQKSSVVIPCWSCFQYYPLYMYPPLLNTTTLNNPGASAILNICRNSEDECVWPRCLSRHFPHKNNLIISVVFGAFWIVHLKPAIISSQSIKLLFIAAVVVLYM